MSIIYSEKEFVIKDNVYTITKEFLKEVYNIEINKMAQKLAKVIRAIDSH